MSRSEEGRGNSTPCHTVGACKVWMGLIVQRSTSTHTRGLGLKLLKHGVADPEMVHMVFEARGGRTGIPG